VHIGPLFRKRCSDAPVADESCEDDPEEKLTIRAIGPIVRDDGTISSPVVGGIKRLAPLARLAGLRAQARDDESVVLLACGCEVPGPGQDVGNGVRVAECRPHGAQFVVQDA
jgi:hypothetical protein